MVTSIIRFKKLALLCATLVFLAVTGGGGNIARAQDECPPGLTERTGLLTINGCAVRVTFCVNCASGTHPTSDIFIKKIEAMGTCQMAPNHDLAIQYIMSEAMNPSFIYGVLCPVGIPCNEGEIETENKNYYCWEATREMGYFGLQVVYRPCDESSYCLERHKWCYDPQTGEYTDLEPYYENHYEPNSSCAGNPMAIATLGPLEGDKTGCCEVTWPCRQP